MNEIIPGSMITFTDENNVYSADVILVRVADEDPEPRKFPPGDPSIPKSINSFFKSKVYSTSQVPKYLNQFEKLEKFLVGEWRY